MPAAVVDTGTTRVAPQDTPPRGTRWPPAARAAATVLFVCLASATLLTTVGRPRWRAQASLVVVPVEAVDSGTDAYRFDTLSRGTVVATYAAILLQERFVQEGGQSISLDPRTLAAMRVGAETSATTAVIVVSVEGDDEVGCERLTTAVIEAGERYIDSLGQPYVVRTVKTAAGSARRTRNFGAVAIVVIGLAPVAGYVLYRSLRPRRSSRRRRGLS